MKLAWSNLAKEELNELRRYSLERWGRDVALRYLEDIRDAAKRLGADPNCARPLMEPFRILRIRNDTKNLPAPSHQIPGAAL